MRNPVKVGKRVYLRPLEEGDARALMAASHTESEPELQGHGRVPVSVLAFASWIRAVGAGAFPEEIVFGVCGRNDDRFLGTVRIGNIDWVNRTGETGTGLLSAGDRGHGIGTEAKHLLLEHAFLDLHFHALISMVFSGNARSVAALRRQGYRLAGRLTADAQRGGVFHDELVFDILRDDWERARDQWGDGGAGGENPAG